MALASTRGLGVLCVILPFLASAVKIWDTPAALGTLIPAGCRAALTTNITCPGKLITATEIVNEVPQNETFLEQYCESTCRNSLQVLPPRAIKGQETRSLTSPVPRVSPLLSTLAVEILSTRSATRQSSLETTLQSHCCGRRTSRVLRIRKLD